MGNPKRVLLVFSDSDTAQLLERSILAPEGYQIVATRTCQEAEKAADKAAYGIAAREDSPSGRDGNGKKGSS